MFGKRTDDGRKPPGNIPAGQPGGVPAALAAPPSAIPDLPLPGSGFGTQSARPADGGQGAVAAAEAKRAEPKTSSRKSENYYDIKSTIFNALIDAIDLTQLGQLDRDAARDEIRDIVNEIITLKDVVMSIAEQEELLEDICNDVLGYGPLEPLLARDDIADIMVNGAGTTFIEVAGKMQKTGVRFRDNAQLLNICQRIVSQIGRRVDEASPICDARLHGRLARQRHRAAAGDRRPHAHHPQVQEGPAQAAGPGALQLDHAGRRHDPRDHRPGALQRADLRRYGFGQDHAAQLSHRLHRSRRARHHLRGRRRTSAAAAACGAPRNPPAQPRGRGRNHHARPRQELPAYASRADHRRRSPRTGGLRPSAGDEHRP